MAVVVLQLAEGTRVRMKSLDIFYPTLPNLDTLNCKYRNEKIKE